MSKETIRGTSGNRNGYKIFSVSTTIRNPLRNKPFLEAFKPYSGRIFDDRLGYRYYFDLVAHGIYKSLRISGDVREKLDNQEVLSDSEVRKIMHDNPQATGIHGRVMTQLRALKDQGFLSFKKVKGSSYYIISFTQLGNDLLNPSKDDAITYTKSYIGLHANSPIRKTIFNESRPFLNTIFVIDEVNRQWSEMGYSAKGVTYYEFGTFILSMKDCDYIKAADEILKYRKLYRFKIDIPYLRKYLNDNGILDVVDNTFLRDYPNEVFKKFEMTGLFKQYGEYGHNYISFSEYNIKKVQLIIDTYKGYKSEHFKSEDDYVSYLSNIQIPWETNERVKKAVVDSKKDLLHIKFDNTVSLDEQENRLDAIFSRDALQKKISSISFKQIYKELLILSGSLHEDSILDSIPESLRLEYLLALLLGKRYGTDGLVSNIIYNEDGDPLHVAPGGRPDIIFINADGSFILEPTMQRGRDQIVNTETESVVRHVENETNKQQIQFYAIMVAPRVHRDVADFFKYQVSSKDAKIIPISIDALVGLIISSQTIKELVINFNKLVSELVMNDVLDYINAVNEYDAVRVYEQI